jgi:hypothetical protein
MSTNQIISKVWSFCNTLRDVLNYDLVDEMNTMNKRVKIIVYQTIITIKVQRQ